MMTKNITWGRDKVQFLADQSSTGMKGFATFWTLVSFLSRCQGDRFGFAHLMLPLGPRYPVLCEEDSAFVDFAMPGKSVLSQGLPGFNLMMMSLIASELV